MQVNKFGMVLDIAQWYQLEPAESQDLCGNAGVATLALSGLPGKGPRGTGEDIDIMADDLAARFNAGPVNELGSTIQDMFNYMNAVQDPTSHLRAMHYQVIPTDQGSIKRALNAGYPVLVTANELNIRSTKTGKRPPYPWKLDASHVLPLMGVDSNGDYIVGDYLNNNFQNEYPNHYDASVLSPTWACVVQVLGPDPNNPWLASIPGNQPMLWPKGFNAQHFAPPATSGDMSPLDRALSITEALAIAMLAGFDTNQSIIIVSIAMAESGLHTHGPDNTAGNTPPSRDRGILQFNSHWHPEMTDAMCYDPYISFHRAYEVTKNGTDFTSWSTFTNGAYKIHMASVTQASGNSFWKTQAADVWKGNTSGSQAGTGIYNHWLTLYISLNIGPPTTKEISTIDWNNNPCIVQFFGSYRIELVHGTYTLYGPGISKGI